jgi:2-polyprenyl-3-methyl-5-hydroxy-6-metoxy-1,4-benzoquinol methylase
MRRSAALRGRGPTGFTFASAKDEQSQAALQELSGRMERFYNSPLSTAYFDCAEEANENWDALDYHRAIREQVTQGAGVLDLGCGSAHAFRNMRSRGISYTGVDWSARQIEENERRFAGSDAMFVAASLYDTKLPEATFDFVLSTYVIEHLVWPHIFLSEMARLIRPGGVGFVLAPEYRRFGRMPSLDYGAPIAPLKMKLKRGMVFSAARHAWRRYYSYPRLLREEYPADTCPFLINLRPTCLAGVYFPDNDAVYCVDSREVLRELEGLGMADVTGEVLDAESDTTQTRGDTCFVAVRKL